MADLLIDPPSERSFAHAAIARVAGWLRAALPYAVLGVLLVAALIARGYNVNWDDYQHLHPDERHLTLVGVDIDLPSDPGEYFATDSSPLNPYNHDVGSFVYGTLPLFSVKAAAVLLDHDNYDEMVQVGRYFSALLDAGTVLLAFLIGRRLFGWTAGLIAAALYASAPLAIQHSHFWVVDPFLTFFTTASLYFCVRIAQEGRQRHYLLAGVCLGLGLASKLTALTIAPVIGIAALVSVWPQLRGWLSASRRRRAPDFLAPAAFGVSAALVTALVVFRIAQPYAFEQPRLGDPLSLVTLNNRWVDDQEQQQRLLGGEASFPPSVQWIGRESYIFPIEQMVEAGMGPVFGVLGWLAVAYAVLRLWRRGDSRPAVLLAFVLVYFGFMGRQFSLYHRYFLPLFPVLAVLAGFALTQAARGLIDWGRRRGWSLQLPAAATVAALVVLAALPGLAYLSIYSQPVTRVEASRWMIDNLPQRARITTEHWDDALPLRLPGISEKQFTLIETPVYEIDSESKVENLLAILDDADYIVLSSNRALNSIPRNEVNYPVTSRYYDYLFDGSLGFQLIRTFESPPRLLGIEFPDSQTQESWSSYDHPRVRIFAKTDAYSSQRAEELLGSIPTATFGLSPAEAERNGLLLTSAELETQREGGTWTDVFSTDGLATRAPAILWFIALQVAALAVLPLTLTLFRRLPDHGYLLAKPLGLLLLAYPVWLLVSLKLVHFEQSTIVLWLGGLLLIAGALTGRFGDELLAFVRGNWRLILFCEALFLAAFFVFFQIRFLNPDLWHPFRGGEKPMDLAYFIAVTRSTTLPPYDPWFAGGYINYYYFGQFLTATLTKLTTIPPEFAFNLAVPTYAALTVAGAFSVAYNLAAFARGAIRRAPGFRRVPRWSLYGAGLLGAFFVVFAGNLDGVGQLTQRLSDVSNVHLATGFSPLDSLVNSIGGAGQVLFHGAELRSFDFWRSSRMMPPQISITEFPYFSFLFADLHAHMMAIPFEVLALAVTAAVALLPRGERGSLREWSLVVLLALVVGALRWINSWDYPPFLLIAIAGIVIGERYLEGGALAAAGRTIAKTVALVGLSFLLFKPFLDSYLTPVAGLHPSPEVTPPHQFLAHFGVFAALIGVWLLYLLARALNVSPLRHLSRAFRTPPPGATSAAKRALSDQLWLTFLIAIGGALVIFMAGLWLEGYQLVALLLPVLAVVAYLAAREFRLQRRDGGLRLFVYSLVGLGLGLSIGVDLVTLDDDIVRMNTVFKFYLHAWVLFALAAAFAGWYLVAVLWRPRRLSTPGRIVVPFVGKLALALLLLGAVIYPLAATPSRIDDRFADLPGTLDGMEYMKTATYQDENGPIDLSYDYEGIRWLRRNVQGTPAIVEGHTPLYRWGARFSIYTGLPTVLGWDWHQTQQRGDLSTQVPVRQAAVENFYAEPEVDQALSFLRRYGVQYVILGQLERLYYPPEGLAKFEDGLGGVLEVAYSNPELTIYRVVNAELQAALP